VPLNRGCVYHHRVRPAEAGAEVLAFHVACYTHTDEVGWRRSIAEGRVRLNGRAAEADERLVAGDALEFHRAPWDEPAAPLAFGVALEDEHVLVLEKPAGLQVLPAGPFHEHTLLRLVRASASGRAESAPAHRLGRGTSGLILFGKSTLARAALARALREGRVTKTYLALAEGRALGGSCVARHTIGPVAVGAWRTWAAHASGKPAVTRLRVLARDRASGRALVAAQPISGRPNQIRIHLAACGAPLVGDPLFGPGGVPGTAPSATGGYLLHAAGLAFAHPASGCWTKVRSRPAWLAGWRTAAYGSALE
jgi:23S rRNA pseudouridine1911/1915/1917 synthase